MGASKNINDLAKENDDFQKYITERNAEMEKTLGEARTQMASQIDDFYKDTKAVPVCSGSYQHLVTSSTWSLDRITDMINAVRGALFGSSPVAATTPLDSKDTKVPQSSASKGTTVEPLSDATKAALAITGQPELVIANAAFQAITGILGTFTSTTETDLSKSIKQSNLTPGLSLFICVVENRYHRTDFFNNDLIIQSFFIYDVRFSVDQAVAFNLQQEVNSLSLQHAAFLSKADDLSAQVKALDFATYKAQFPKLADAMAAYKGDLTVYSGMLDDLDKQATLTMAKIAALKATSRLEAINAIAAKRRAAF